MNLETKFSNTLWHNALPIGKFYHAVYGEINITKELVEKMAQNFKNGFPHYKPPINISHNDLNGAYGTIEDVEAKEDGLWVKMNFTEEGQKLLEQKKFNYLSAEFTTTYIDPNTGNDVGPVLLGVALTNRPAHPKVKPLKMSQVIKNFLQRLFTFGGDILEEIIMLEDYEDMPKDEDSPWDWDWAKDADEIIEKFGYRGLAKVTAWHDTSEDKFPEKKAAYKLPFGKVKNGKLTIYWSGVRAAMAALLGARGGVDIPKEDKKKVYSLLARLYRLFNKEPPEFHYEEGETEVIQMQEKITSLEQQIQTLQTQLQQKDAMITELEQQIKTMQLDHAKKTWLSEGYEPAAVENVYNMVKSGKITLETAHDIIRLCAKVKMEQIYTPQEKKEVSLAEIALQDAKKLGFVRRDG